MENQEFQKPEVNNLQHQSSGVPQIPLPNATVILILGIVSIVGCCCYGIIGIICGAVALIMAKSAKSLYESNPSLYTESSLGNVKTGRICGLIGLSLSILYLILFIIVIAIYGLVVLTDPEGFVNTMQGM